MLLGLRLFALGIVLISSMLAASNPAHASGLSRDAEALGLAHYIMAVCHDLNGESALAINEYQQSVQYNGLESAPRLKLGAYYLQLSEVGKAAVQLKQVLRLTPQETQAHYLLALIYSSEHKYDLAAEEYETILKSAAKNDPANIDTYMFLGQLYYSESKFPQAIDQLSKIMRLDPANVSALCLLGAVYADSKNRSEAISTFRQVLRMDPENTEALNSLGYMYAEDGVHLDEALRMVRHALEIDPANGAYYDSLGWVLYKKKMYAESLMALQKAGTYIEDKLLYDHIGDVYKVLKDYTQACAFWRKSLDLDPHQTLVQQKINVFEKCIASKSKRQLN